jgi:two-component system, chemotaxis family, chemotaxis protein CheY
VKVLIVEDDPISSQVLEKMISRHGSYDTVADGTAAVQLFQRAHESRSPYDLILMDIMIPEVDGLKSVHEMRRQEVLLEVSLGRKAKIIMTTALDDPRTIMKALYESDANSYLVKPIRLQRLEEELRSLKLIS